MESPLKNEFRNYTYRRSFRNNAHIDDKKQANSNIQKRWRLFYATDFQSLMYPCFTFCRILGIFPYRINNSTFEISESCNILSTIVIFAFCVCGIIVYKLNISKSIMSIPGFLERHSYYVLGSFTAIITYVLRRPRLLLLQTILEISSELSSEFYQKLSKLIHVKDIFGFFLIVIQGIIYYIYLPSNTILLIFTTYLSLLMLQMDIMYINCVYVLKACFKKINDNLMKMRKLILNDKPHLLRRIYHEQKNPFLLIKLKALKKQHLMVSDTVQMFNMIFNMQIIVTIVISFAQITFSLYFYIILFIAKNEENFWYWCFILRIIYHITKTVLIVWTCDSCKNQATKIGITVHDLLNSTNDEQINDELELFSMQILQQENAFSAKGLTMDATLLTAMVGNITTYLLILIQSLIASHSCNEKAVTIIEIL